MRKRKDYSAWSKEDLIKHIHALEKRKKYGLVWDQEQTPEQFEHDAQNALPVLKQVLDKAIHTSADDPTHILIEGDNFHALSVLNYTHEKAVDVIYIDPPYNTGNQDFRYNDKFVEKEDAYRHSKWLSFMDKRLRLAKDLLKDTGIIFISIDDNEMAQLKILCDEIFSEANLVQILIWHSKYTVSNDAKFFSKQHEYVLCYARDIRHARINLLPRTVEANDRYSNPDEDPRGAWKPTPLHAKSGTDKSKYEYQFSNGVKWFPPDGRFPRFSQNTLRELDEENRIWFGKKGDGTPSVKTFLSEVAQGVKSGSLLPHAIFGHTHKANEQLATVLGKGKFDNPKPIDLISGLIRLGESDANTIVLDFFAGSGTTAHAVLEMNVQDGEKGQRQFILCTDNQNNICTEVCYPRVKKAIKGFKSTQGATIKELGGNLNYYRTAFVPAAPTDANKQTLTLRSVEMLCLRENTFEFVRENSVWKIFKNQARYTAILFDNLAIPKFKKELAKLDMPISVYIFSLGDETFEDEFEDMTERVSVRSIPEAILRVYRRIYQ